MCVEVPIITISYYNYMCIYVYTISVHKYILAYLYIYICNFVFYRYSMRNYIYII